MVGTTSEGTMSPAKCKDVITNCSYSKHHNCKHQGNVIKYAAGVTLYWCGMSTALQDQVD